MPIAAIRTPSWARRPRRCRTRLLCLLDRRPWAAQSVLAAGNNVPTRMTYVPVPVATVPDPYRPPVPPAPRMPAAPQPNAYVNAFTPQAPPTDKTPPNPMMVNAFGNGYPPATAAPLPPGMPTPPPYMPNVGYQPNPMAQGYPMAPGYPPNPNMMAAQGVPNPYFYQGAVQQASMQQQALLQQQAMMNYQAMMQQQAAMAQQNRPMLPVNYPQNYQGPQAPNPFAQHPIQPVQYQQVVMPQPAINVAMDRRLMPAPAVNNQELSQLLQVLRESPYPAQREWAANSLSTYDWRAHPELVQVLLQVAQQDPAAVVRASCVYSLGRMNAACEPVITTMYTLRNDGDPRVRQEVEQTLTRLGANKQK